MSPLLTVNSVWSSSTKRLRDGGESDIEKVKYACAPKQCADCAQRRGGRGGWLVSALSPNKYFYFPKQFILHLLKGDARRLSVLSPSILKWEAVAVAGHCWPEETVSKWMKTESAVSLNSHFHSPPIKA